jgi:hypothetical protein
MDKLRLSSELAEASASVSLLEGIEMEQWAEDTKDSSMSPSTSPNHSCSKVSRAPSLGNSKGVQQKEDAESSPTSHEAERWSLSDDVPLLKEDNLKTATEGEELQAPDPPKKERKDFIKPEHKIALSHFLVSTPKQLCVTSLTIHLADIHIFDME